MSDASYSKDRSWSDRYLPEICKIVGPLLLKPAPLELDMKEATDLILLTAKDIRIACRIRRPGYEEKYPFEFTMRESRRDTGAVTEIYKIMAGFGDWFFYGHAGNTREPLISRWMIVDLCSFRHHVYYNQIRFTQKENFDQHTTFIAFDARTTRLFPPLLVAQSW